MSAYGELGGTAFQKLVSQRLDSALASNNVPQDTRDMFINSLEMMYEYIPYAISQKKNPSDGKVLAAFLASKGRKMAKYLGNDTINCGVALVEFIKSTAAATEVSTSPGVLYLPVPVLAWGLAALDLIEVGNSCEFVQDATYHVFLKDSSNTIRQTKAVVDNAYASPGLVQTLH